MAEQNEEILNEELQHLMTVQKIIREQIDEVENSLGNSKEDIMKQKRYLWENIYELDPEEIASNRQSISEEHDTFEMRESKKRLLLKLQDNTYFGRVDFVYEGDSEEEAEVLYIGLGGLRSKSGIITYVYDWRAPISSMYYDYDIGPASYEAPMGTIGGYIIKKRQLKVRKGNLEYALDSGLKIDDEILQKELSGNGSIKMRNIVATIQKEQNSIVRDQTSTIMLVQGVAGSGKTSIALHRIAFLLYQNRSNLNSSDILIISPNNIFADYISNVLPELGEQNISEVSFDEIAQHEMKGICKYETKYEQMEYIIKCRDESDERIERIRFKGSIQFLEEMKKYVEALDKQFVEFDSYTLNGYKVEGSLLKKLYEGIFSTKAPIERLDMIGDRIADMYENDNNAIISVSSRNDIKQSIRGMAKTSNVLENYRDFICTLSSKYDVEQDDYISDNYLQYEDVFPVVLLKFMLYGKQNPQFARIKHVIVDEMQDYSMVQYEILSLLFKCKMTILGDVNQVVDKSNDLVLENVQKVFNEKVSLIKMMKSYRSTFEISEFCRKLCSLEDAESFERHGKVPVFQDCESYDGMVKRVQEKIDETDLSQITTAVVICKSSEAAETIYSSLEDEYKEKCYLMNKQDADFHEGFIITNSYLVKGLEFDNVIVPDVTEAEYQTERDRQILYIACTRALHELDILYYGTRSKFLDETLSKMDR